MHWPPTVTKYADCVRIRIFPLKMLLPDLHKIVTDELSGVMACPQGEISGVCPDIIDAMRYNCSVRKGLEIMVAGFWLSFA